MVRKIEKGITTITVKEKIKNINGCYGVSRYGSRWRVEIEHKHSKRLVGIFDTLEDSVQARKIAEYYRDNNMLEQWLSKKPHGNTAAYCKFWLSEFEKHNHK